MAKKKIKKYMCYALANQESLLCSILQCNKYRAHFGAVSK